MLYMVMVCSCVRKMYSCQENRPPTPHTHTIIRNNIMHMYCSSHLSGNFRLIRKIETPPTSTHGTHKIHYTFMYTQYITHTLCAYSTYSHLSGKCFLVRKIETPSHHTHTIQHMCTCAAYSETCVCPYA